MEGWISLHRQIVDNWIWKSQDPFDKRSAWIDLLLMVNHKTEKIEFNGNMIEIERGQKITSIDKLATKWKWSRHKVSDFLNRLEAEHMLVQVRDNKKTLISIENYNKYQMNVGQKWDEIGTADRTPIRTSKNDVEDIENTEKKDITKSNLDVSVDMRKDIKRTAEGHKQ